MKNFKKVIFSILLCLCLICFAGCSLLGKDYDAKITELEQSITDLQAQIERLEQEINKLKSDNLEQSTKIKNLEDQLAELKKQSNLENAIVLKDDLKTEQFEVHFIEPGTYNAGDIIYIKAGDNDILIDSGAPSANTRTKIKNYLAKEECMGTDLTIEYLIVTHAHSDHYGNLTQKTGSLFETYKFGTIIDFTLTNQNTVTSSGNATDYQKYLDNVEKEIADDGAKHFSAKQCFDNEDGAQREFTLGNNLKMEILYNKYYYQTSSDENNYSVSTLFTHGTSKYLFTGDLEKDGEQAMIDYYNTNDSKKLENVVLYKANHHGSKTSSSDNFMEIISPKISVVMCCAGSTEYTKDLLNTFPTQKFIDVISKYTDMVYCPSICTNPSTKEYKSLCGDIVIFSKSDKITVQGSEDTIKLKDSDLFKNFELYGKTLPNNWKVA